MTKEHELWLQKLGVPEGLFAQRGTTDVAQPRHESQPDAKPEPGFGNQPDAKPEPGFGNQPRELPPQNPKDVSKKETVPGAMKKTPYGNLVAYMPIPKHPLARTFEAFTTDATKWEGRSREARDVLDKYLAKEKEVQSVAEKYTANLDTEIDANTSPAAANVARDLEQQRQHLKLDVRFLRSLKDRIEEAQRHLTSARLKLQSAQDLDAAHDLSEKASKWDRDMGLELAALGSGIDFITKLGTGNIAGLGKSVWDGVSALSRLHTNNPFSKAAKDKWRSGSDKAIQAAFADIDNANQTIASAADNAKDTERELKKSFEYYEKLQAESEGLYDKSTKGNFKFGTLAKLTQWAELGVKHADASVANYEIAYFHADKLRDAYRAVLEKLTLKDEFSDVFIEGSLTAKAMANAVALARAEEQKKARRITSLNASLSRTRDKANVKLAHSKASSPK